MGMDVARDEPSSTTLHRAWSQYKRKHAVVITLVLAKMTGHASFHPGETALIMADRLAARMIGACGQGLPGGKDDCRVQV